jgi:PKD repeat protein
MGIDSAMKALYRFALVASALGAACTVHGTDVPELTGPSEYGLSVVITATPDSITQDGASQSSIVIVARDANGKGVSAVSMRVETAVDGTVQDYGLLSARTVVTGSDGRATLVYTAPPPPPSIGGSGIVVTVGATPIGSNYQASNTQTVAIRLLPPGVVLPPASAPTARFSVSPVPVSAGIPANFDGSASCATQAACSSTAGITNFAWNFGDGSSGAGQIVTHAFAAPGTYNVTLTVTNDRGLSTPLSQAVTVGASADPSVVIDVSPGDPITTGTVVNLSGERSKAAPGRTLTQFNWNLGTSAVVGPTGQPVPGGQFPTGLRQSIRFTVPGRYTVILSVLDDAGQKGTATVTVNVQ